MSYKGKSNTSSGSGSKFKEIYLPEPEILARMDKHELSVWRAAGRKQRKAERQRIKRTKMSASKEKSKHGLRYNPPGKYVVSRI